MTDVDKAAPDGEMSEVYRPVWPEHEAVNRVGLEAVLDESCLQIVACMQQGLRLTGDEEEPFDTSQLSVPAHEIAPTLTEAVCTLAALDRALPASNHPTFQQAVFEAAIELNNYLNEDSPPTSEN